MWEQWNLWLAISAFANWCTATKSQQRGKQWQEMALSLNAARLCPSNWTHDCVGFPQITWQLPWIGARRVWLWRLLWHAITAGALLAVWLRQWGPYPSIFLAMHLLFVQKYCIFSYHQRITPWLFFFFFYHFLDLSQKLIISWKKAKKWAKAERSCFIPPGVYKLWELYTQNGQNSCRPAPPPKALSIFLCWMLRPKI